MKQVKLNFNDPDFRDINPEIIKFAETNGAIRQLIELYLSGRTTWMQSLETMVTTIAKEMRKQQRMLVEVQMETSKTTAVLLTDTPSVPLLEQSRSSEPQHCQLS